MIEDLGTEPGNGMKGVVDSEGRILALAREADGGWDFAVYRYLPSGDLDPTWGENGMARIDVDGNDNPSDIALTPDGGVVVVGSSGPLATQDLSLVKLTASGDPDQAFSGDGKLVVDFGGRDAGHGVAVTPDGRYVAVGVADVSGAGDMAVAVVRSDGQLDTDFSTDGRMTLDLGDIEFANAVAITGDGAFAVAGESGGDLVSAVVLPSGSLDPGFSGDGLAIHDAGSISDGAYDIAVDTSGRILIGGHGFDVTSDFVILRYNRNGTLDASFGDQGVTRFPIGDGINFLRGVAVAPTGHVVLAGYTGDSPNRNVAVGRLTADGELDGNFGQGGITTTDVGGDDFGRGVAVGEDGTVFVIGDTTTAGTRDLLIIAYEGTSPPSPPDPKLECVESFDDDNGHTFEKDINCIASAGITRGCNPPANTRFCPDARVTRGQMAAFLARALDLAASGESFIDAQGHTFEKDIAALAGAGITRGCNPPVNDRFCPDERVTRGQMAAFLARALDLAASGESFIDAQGHTFEKDIAALAGAGITRGCNPPVNDRFCPDQPVTRGQMAAFLNRALLSD